VIAWGIYSSRFNGIKRLRT